MNLKWRDFLTASVSAAVSSSVQAQPVSDPDSRYNDIVGGLKGVGVI